MGASKLVAAKGIHRGTPHDVRWFVGGAQSLRGMWPHRTSSIMLQLVVPLVTAPDEVSTDGACTEEPGRPWAARRAGEPPVNYHRLPLSDRTAPAVQRTERNTTHESIRRHLP